MQICSVIDFWLTISNETKICDNWRQLRATSGVSNPLSQSDWQLPLSSHTTLGKNWM